MIQSSRAATTDESVPARPAILIMMPWQLPKDPEDYHPNRRMLLTRELLFLLHCVQKRSPREISELQKRAFGFTIAPQGVAMYLKAYGFYRPRRGKPLKPVRRWGGNGSLYCLAPKHRLRNRFNRVLYGWIIAERKFGRLDPREWRVVYLDGDRLNCSPENIAIKRTRIGQAAQLLREARTRALFKSEVRFLRRIVKPMSFSLSALVRRTQLLLGEDERVELLLGPGTDLADIVLSLHPWLSKLYPTMGRLRRALCRSLGVHVHELSDLERWKREPLPRRYARLLDRHGHLPLLSVLGEPVPDRILPVSK